MFAGSVWHGILQNPHLDWNPFSVREREGKKREIFFKKAEVASFFFFFFWFGLVLQHDLGDRRRTSPSQSWNVSCGLPFVLYSSGAEGAQRPSNQAMVCVFLSLRSVQVRVGRFAAFCLDTRSPTHASASQSLRAFLAFGLLVLPFSIEALQRRGRGGRDRENATL